MTALDYWLLTVCSLQCTYIIWLHVDNMRRIRAVCEDFRASLDRPQSTPTLTVIHKHENPWTGIHLETGNNHDA